MSDPQRLPYGLVKPPPPGLSGHMGDDVRLDALLDIAGALAPTDGSGGRVLGDIATLLAVGSRFRPVHALALDVPGGALMGEQAAEAAIQVLRNREAFAPSYEAVRSDLAVVSSGDGRRQPRPADQGDERRSGTHREVPGWLVSWNEERHRHTVRIECHEEHGMDVVSDAGFLAESPRGVMLRKMRFLKSLRHEHDPRAPGTQVASELAEHDMAYLLFRHPLALTPDERRSCAQLLSPFPEHPDDAQRNPPETLPPFRAPIGDFIPSMGAERLGQVRAVIDAVFMADPYLCRIKDPDGWLEVAPPPKVVWPVADSPAPDVVAAVYRTPRDGIREPRLIGRFPSLDEAMAWLRQADPDGPAPKVVDAPEGKPVQVGKKPKASPTASP